MIEGVVDADYIKSTDQAATIVATVLGAFGLIFNGFFIYIVLRRTPEALRCYSILLLNFGIFDFLACLCSMLAIQKPIFSGAALTYIFHGPCGLVSPFLCYLSHCVGCHAYAHSQWILLISFIYRFRILVSRQPSPYQIFCYCLLMYIPSFIFLVVYSTDVGDSNALKRQLYKFHPEYHFDNQKVWGSLVVSGNENVMSWITGPAIVYMCVPCLPIYATILHFRKQTLVLLNSSVLTMSTTTRRLHRQLVKALTVQACMPIFYLTAATLYLLTTFDALGGPLVENVIFRLMECIPMLTPLVSLYCVTPYKLYLQRWAGSLFQCSKNSNENPLNVSFPCASYNERSREVEHHLNATEEGELNKALLA